MNALAPTSTLAPCAGDEARFAAVYRAHKGAVYRICLRYGAGDVRWAEDVTGDVFVTALERFDGLAATEALGGWLYRVATRHCLKRLRRDRIRRTLGLERPAVDDRPDPARRALGRQRLHAALRLLDALPPKQRVALCMHRLGGRTMAEIGAVMGHSKGYVCKLVARADARLRALDEEAAHVG